MTDNCQCEHENACNSYGGEKLCHCCFLIRVGLASKDTWVPGKICTKAYCMSTYNIPKEGFELDDGNGKAQVNKVG